MRILYLSQYFPPEAGATQTRAYEMARHFVTMGHAVTMLTEVPNHPSGIIFPEYRGKVYERSELEGIEVIRVWVKASPHKNFVSRVAFYLTFMVNSTLAELFLVRNCYDLIYASSPPLFVGGAALALHYLKRTPMVFEVRDLWPESAVALGEMTNPLAISFATGLEEACYRRAKAIVAVTQGVLNRLLERGIPAEKLFLIPNGANVDLFQFRREGRVRLRNELGLQDTFIAVYAGIHGIAQGLETVIEAALQLQHTLGIHFLFVGDGPKKPELVSLASKYRLSNLTFIPEQPRDRIPDFLSAADVALVPLRNLELFKKALPSKIFDAWACQCPVLLGVEGEARRLLEQAQGGIFVPPEDATALADALLTFKSNGLLRDHMGASGRAFVVKHYSRQALAAQLIHVLEQINTDAHQPIS